MSGEGTDAAYGDDAVDFERFHGGDVGTVIDLVRGVVDGGTGVCVCMVALDEYYGFGICGICVDHCATVGSLNDLGLEGGEKVAFE